MSLSSDPGPAVSVSFHSDPKELRGPLSVNHQWMDGNDSAVHLPDAGNADRRSPGHDSHEPMTGDTANGRRTD